MIVWYIIYLFAHTDSTLHDSNIILFKMHVHAACSLLNWIGANLSDDYVYTTYIVAEFSGKIYPSKNFNGRFKP